MALGFSAYLVLTLLLLTIIALVREWARPDWVLLGGLGILLLTGVLTPQDAFAGFSNSAVLTVAALFVVAAGVEHTNALGFLDQILFGKLRSLPRMLLNLMVPVAGLSAFLNNTPVVAMLIPRLQHWASQNQIAASKVFIPLSYAAIIGGMTTLIGTSTNIIVSGLMEEEGYPALGMFDVSWVGIPAAVVVILYFVLIGHRFLPERGQDGVGFTEGLKKYLFELRVKATFPYVGQTVEAAGLRALGDAYLVHLRREGHLVPAGPKEILRADDVLTFSGDASALERLLERVGLERVVAFDASAPVGLPMYEAVVAPTSTMVGQTLKEAGFREQFNGVVLGIQRRDEQIGGPLGRIPIKAGDLLLIEANTGFMRQSDTGQNEFYLVAPLRAARPKPQPQKAPLALGLTVAMVVVAAMGWLPLVTTAFATALAMVGLGCLSGGAARRALDFSVLIVIAAALGLGKAITQTGLADALASGMEALVPMGGALGVLLALYVFTNILTELITHKAAAVLMLPVALNLATHLGADPKAFGITVAVAAAASFMTPIGYQTNLMVMSAGGYRYADYFKVGLPVSLLVMGITLSVVYIIWL